MDISRELDAFDGRYWILDDDSTRQTYGEMGTEHKAQHHTKHEESTISPQRDISSASPFKFELIVDFHFHNNIQSRQT